MTVSVLVLATHNQANLGGQSTSSSVRRNVFGTGPDYACPARMEIVTSQEPELLTGRATARLRLPPAAALAGGGVAAVLLIAALPLAVAAHQFTTGMLFLLVFVPFAAVGTVVGFRQAQNPIGWLLLLLAIGVVAGTDAGYYSVCAYRVDHHGLPLSRVAVLLTSGWIAFALLPLPILLFPGGTARGRVWGWTLRVYLMLTAFFVVAVGVQNAKVFTARRIHVDSSGEIGGSSKGFASAAAAVALAVLALLSICWVVRQIVRYRRSIGVERQQLKWLMAGGAICIGGFLFSIVGGGARSEPWRALADAGPFAIMALPLSIGVGILRYRLYEIDRLISRTISYSIVTGLLGGVFVGVVALTTGVLPFSSPVGVAVSTLVAAALFSPLRLRTQRLVDRRFNRARFDAEATVAAFAARLRNAVDLETIHRELLGAVGETIAPEHASLWIRPARIN